MQQVRHQPTSWLSDTGYVRRQSGIQSTEEINARRLRETDIFMVCFSGGKDSLACLLHLIEIGVPRDKILCCHHCVDGDPEAGQRFMDWPVTEAYCRAVTAWLGVELRYSWRRGGIHDEMERNNSPSALVEFESMSGQRMLQQRSRPVNGTRQRFPQVSGDLTVRWCSPSVKIDVLRRVITNDDAFSTGTFVVVSGERREESPNRAKYQEEEPHATNNQKRRVTQWRPVIDWSEQEVWAIIRRHGIIPHPAYQLGFGRVSCMFCIFGGPDQFASARNLDPDGFEAIAEKEEEYGVTIKRSEPIRVVAAKGRSFIPSNLPLKQLAMSRQWSGPIRCDPSQWELPSGAFKKHGGPS